MRRRPEYRWDVEVLPRPEDPNGDGRVDGASSPRPADGALHGSSEHDAD
jgi:hypothetical protein